MLYDRRAMLALGMLAAAPQLRAAGGKPKLCVFSKHLADTGLEDLGKVAKDLGYEGIDLTVRPKGHVLPENAGRDLPKAVEAIERDGLPVTMITTGLTSASDPAARPTLEAAAKLKIPYFKPGYYQYRDQAPQTVLPKVRKDLTELVALAADYGIAAGFHNHSGTYVGAAVWDTRDLIEQIPPDHIGYYFDPGHATIEGGLGGWQISLRLVLPRLKMVSLKDFVWSKEKAKWNAKWTPMGEGMVQWPEVFRAMAASGFSGPMSMHLEYHATDEKEALRRDAEFARQQIDRAWGATGS